MLGCDSYRATAWAYNALSPPRLAHAAANGSNTLTTISRALDCPMPDPAGETARQMSEQVSADRTVSSACVSGPPVLCHTTANAAAPFTRRSGRLAGIPKARFQPGALPAKTGAEAKAGASSKPAPHLSSCSAMSRRSVPPPSFAIISRFR